MDLLDNAVRRPVQMLQLKVPVGMPQRTRGSQDASGVGVLPLLPEKGATARRSHLRSQEHHILVFLGHHLRSTPISRRRHLLEFENPVYPVEMWRSLFFLGLVGLCGCDDEPKCQDQVLILPLDNARARQLSCSHTQHRVVPLEDPKQTDPKNKGRVLLCRCETLPNHSHPPKGQ